jgi:two-component system LytT family sensor kinase
VPDTASRPRVSAFALTLGVWAVVALIFMVQNLAQDLTHGRAIQWRRDVYEESLYWIAFALLTPLLVWLSRRFSFIGGNWRRALAAHALAAPAVASLQVAVYFALVVGLGLTLGELALAEVPGWLGTRGALFLILAITAYWKYWVIVGLLHGLAYARLYSREQRAAAELRAQLNGAQLDRLRAQLQPHFLFNTLNSIAVLLRDDPERARTMVLRLGELLRAVVDSGNEPFVPLGRELAFIEQYLAIQQIRFGERLRVTLDISADRDRETVPHFLIQPLVENAVQHGIATRESGGTVLVGVHRQDGDLHIEVTDTPVNPAERGAEAPGSGVGLTNTRERLETLYGSAARPTLDPLADGGMRVTVRIPSTNGR